MKSLTFTAATLSLSLILLPARAVIATPSTVDEFAYAEPMSASLLLLLAGLAVLCERRRCRYA